MTLPLTDSRISTAGGMFGLDLLIGKSFLYDYTDWSVGLTGAGASPSGSYVQEGYLGAVGVVSRQTSTNNTNKSLTRKPYRQARQVSIEVWAERLSGTPWINLTYRRDTTSVSSSNQTVSAGWNLYTARITPPTATHTTENIAFGGRGVSGQEWAASRPKAVAVY